jgi:hypothetical protein
MIKKFMSKALLSVFMDKKARKILHAVRTAKEMPTTSSKVNPLVDLSQSQSQSESDPLSYMDNDKITALIRESLDKAEKEVIDTQKSPLNKTTKSAVSQSRLDLIDNALTIHKSKSHIIDELPAEQRERLKLLAFQLFSEQLKDS